MIECKANKTEQSHKFSFRKIKLYLGSTFLSDEKPTEISDDRLDNRIKFISTDHTKKKHLFLIGNGIEKKRYPPKT